MMRILTSTLFVLVAVLLLVASTRYMVDALYIGAIEKHVQTLSRFTIEEGNGNENWLYPPNSNALLTTAHSLDTYGSLLLWKNYLTQNSSSLLRANEIYLSSSHLRPTWPSTHIELAKLANKNGDTRAEEMHRTASIHFGPYSTSTLLFNIDYIYSNWTSMAGEKRVKASIQLLSIARKWKYRPLLNQMITYSPGKQRICNMLAFNKVKVSACQ